MENKNLKLTVLILIIGFLATLFIIWCQNPEIGLKDPIVPILVGVAGSVAFFLIIREIITWYWKINRMVDLLEKIERNTARKEDQKC